MHLSLYKLTTVILGISILALLIEELVTLKKQYALVYG